MFVVLTGLMGCASVSIKTTFQKDYAFKNLKTYVWLHQPEDAQPAAELGFNFRERVRRAIARALSPKGFKSAAAGKPDFYVLFYTNVHLKTRTWISSVGAPYTQAPFGPWPYSHLPYGTWTSSLASAQYGGWAYPWGSQVYVEPVEVGTMVIDIVDVKTRRIVWRGWGRGLVDPAAPDNDLVNVARKVMENFPPA